MDFRAFLKDASEEFLAKHFRISSFKYKIVLQYLLQSKTKIEGFDINVIKYMLCVSLIESIHLPDLESALDYLFELERDVGESLPMVYYALAKTHIKFCRFHLALEVIGKGFKLLNKNQQFSAHYIPTTNHVIQESTNAGLLNALITLKDECLKWHRPDAVCSVVKCQNRSRHYSASRDIYLSDPSVKGMVTIMCNNINPCVLKYHNVCWDHKKQEISDTVALTDEEMLGHTCFTSHHKDDKIMRIEIFIKSTNSKRVFEAPDLAPSTSQQSLIKGAIKKQFQEEKQTRNESPKPNSVKSLQEEPLTGEICHNEQTEANIQNDWRIKKLMKLRQENFGIPPEENWKPNEKIYGNTNVASIWESIAKPDFTDDTENAHIKSFVFDFLYSYIKENGPISVTEAVKKWEEVNTMIGDETCNLNKQTDVTEFLLQSPKIVMIGNQLCVPEILPKAYHQVKTDIIKRFKEFMKDKEKIQDYNEDSMESIHERKSLDIWKHSTSPFLSPNNAQKNENSSLLLSFKSPDCFQNSNKNSMNSKNGTESLNFTELCNSTLNLLQDEENNESSEICKEILKHIKPLSDKSENDTTSQDVSELLKDSEELNVENLLEQRNTLRAELQATELFSKSIFDKYMKLEKESLLLKSKMTLLQDEKVSGGDRKLLAEQGVKVKAYDENWKLLEEINTYKTRLEEKERELEILKHRTLEMKRTMLQKMLFYQFLSNQFYISRNIEQCKLTLAVISKLNYIFNKSFRFRPLSDHIEWEKARNTFELLSADNEKEYKKLKTLLQSDEYVEARDDTVLQLNNIPAFPTRTLLEIVECALNKYEESAQVLHHSMLQPPMGYRFMGPNPFLLPRRPPPLLNGMRPNVHMHPMLRMPPPPNFIHNIRQQTSSLKNPVGSSDVISEEVHKLEGESGDINTEQNNSIPTNCMDSARDSSNGTKLSDAESQCKMKIEGDNKGDTVSNSDCTNRENEPLNIGDVAECDVAIKGETTNNEDEEFERRCENNIVQDADLNTVRNNIVHSEDMYLKRRDINEENNKNADEPNMRLSKQFRKILRQLESDYTGIMEFDILTSIMDVKKQHNNTLTGLPFKVILKEAQKYILERQEEYLCMYTVSEPVKLVKGQEVSASNKYQAKDKKLKRNLPLSLQLKKMSKATKNPTLKIPKKVNKMSENQRQQPNPMTQKVEITPINNKSQSITSKICAWNLDRTSVGTWKKCSEENECIICMESIKQISKPVYTLTCQHSFHKTCIKKWFQHSQSCPTCRVHCTIDDEFPPLPS